ncbi:MULTISPECIES: MarR family winged helix-turn-helix transcriptional regulator [Mammaliicoccus]|uniref:MarR family winged helix-turn-helix transcriptional regulator n=1 Tax=Mammaliicoccus TaxID=2803850 RepID=UPI0002E7FD59|nr:MULTISPECIES: MarR family transcriptional regulator [Mammaliicoccus]MBF0841931.1 MarR family transcriptional regulator [Mammaliicoccus lentus]MBW0768052.1 MarR family transcriptional regulator [Mammaliicoccus lentus]PTI72795.1 MarR family transcriptional regulator [Mammaliicoccus vitulinus]
MNEFYLIDSPSFAKLKELKNEYSNLDITSVLLYLEIQKAYKKMKLNHDVFLQKFDLSESKFTIMMLLSYEKDKMLSPSALSEKIGSKKSTITGVLKGLEKKGLVRRKILSEDKRTNYVQLTDFGLGKLQEFLPYNYEVVSKVFEVFSEEEKEQFYRLANKLKNNLEKDDLF